MYNVIECPANEHFRQPAWRVSGPGVDRFFAEEDEAARYAVDVERAYIAGQMEGMRFAGGTLDKIIERRLATA